MRPERQAIVQTLPQGGRTMIQQWETQWFNVREGITTLPANWDWLKTQVYWDFGEPGKTFNNARGRIGAHRFETCGEKKVVARCVNALGEFTRDFFVNVGPDQKGNYKPKTFDELVQFAAKAQTVIDCQNQTFHFTKSVTLGTGTRVKNLKAIADKSMGVFFTPSSNNTLLDITFDCPYLIDKIGDVNGQTAAWHPGDRCTMFHCTLLHTGTANDCNKKPSKVFICNNSAPLMHGFMGYMIWGEGSMIVGYGNYVRNGSGGSHCTRFGGVTNGVLFQNDYSNLDTRVGNTAITDGSAPFAHDQWDQARNAITIHLNTGIDMIENICRSQGIQVGPLGLGDGVTKIDYPNVVNSDMQVLDNVCDYLSDCRFQVGHGTVDLWLKGNKFSTPTRQVIFIEGIDKASYPVKLADGSTVQRTYQKSDGTYRHSDRIYIDADNVCSTRSGDALVYVGPGATNVVNALTGHGMGYARFSALVR
jgi:hypothetical protein